MSASAVSTPTPQAAAAPAAASADGQQDYSKEWAAYYRYYGNVIIEKDSLK